MNAEIGISNVLVTWTDLNSGQNVSRGTVMNILSQRDYMLYTGTQTENSSDSSESSSESESTSTSNYSVDSAG